MNERTVVEIAERFGMVIEGALGLPGDERSFRVYKGANQVFTGSEQAVRKFFVRYEKDRPQLFAERIHGYKE